MLNQIYSALQGEVDAAVRSGDATAVDQVLAASAPNGVVFADVAVPEGRQIYLKLSVAGTAAATSGVAGCALLRTIDSAAYWRGIQCFHPTAPDTEVSLPDGSAIAPLPGPVSGNDRFPGEADVAVERQLAALPPVITAVQARQQVEDAVAAVVAVASTPGDLPFVTAQVQPGADGTTEVAVAVFSYADRHCILATRVDGIVTLWRPAAISMQPGEGTCDTFAAFGGLYQRPPH